MHMTGKGSSFIYSSPSQNGSGVVEKLPASSLERVGKEEALKTGPLLATCMEVVLCAQELRIAPRINLNQDTLKSFPFFLSLYSKSTSGAGGDYSRGAGRQTPQQSFAQGDGASFAHTPGCCCRIQHRVDLFP